MSDTAQKSSKIINNSRLSSSVQSMLKGGIVGQGSHKNEPEDDGEQDFSQVRLVQDQSTKSPDAKDQLDKQAVVAQQTERPDSMPYLDILDEVLNEVEEQKSNPQARALLDQLAHEDPVLTQSAGGVGKERMAQGAVIESGASLQHVEPERSPEIPPEVDKYLKEVSQEPQHLPEEIVIAEDQPDLPDQGSYQAQPVVVLPITPEVEKRGARKSPKFSIRWLVEWSRKIMKVFSGKVVYRQTEEGGA